MQWERGAAANRAAGCGLHFPAWQGVFPDTLVLDTSDQPGVLGGSLFYRIDAITAPGSCNCSRE